MTCQLIFVHGRAQEMKDAGALKAEWIAAFERGLAKSGLSLPVAETDIHMPYYGQALFDIAGGASEAAAARVVVKSADADAGDADRREFITGVLLEVCEARALDDAALDTLAAEKGILQWDWVQGLLAAIDRHVPGASGTSIALATNDVYQYLRNPGIAGIIDKGVREAIAPRVPAVVVSHSLGTVVAYNLLRRDGLQFGWKVPLFVTLGSPLSVTAIRRALQPIGFPACAARWFNASDPHDVVALHPMNKDTFDVDPAIENKTDVANHTPNHHGIVGYLDDIDVARRIHDALVAAS